MMKLFKKNVMRNLFLKIIKCLLKIKINFTFALIVECKRMNNIWLFRLQAHMVYILSGELHRCLKVIHIQQEVLSLAHVHSHTVAPDFMNLLTALAPVDADGPEFCAVL